MHKLSCLSKKVYEKIANFNYEIQNLDCPDGFSCADSAAEPEGT